MSDIRFNQWLHNSGTGGVSQVDGGHVGIGTTNPLIPVGAGNTSILNVGVVTANSYYGSGANLTGVLKNIVEDTSPQLGANLDCNNKNISLNDSTGGTNNRIKIGTNDDLQLWHNASTGNSNVSNYNGDLYIQGNNGSGTGVNQIAIKSNAAVELNYQAGKRFETTNEGATFSTGSSSCVVRLTSNNSSVHVLQAFNNDLNIKAPSSGGISLYTDGSLERVRITSGGNIGMGVVGHDPLTRLHVQDSNNGALKDVLTMTNQNGSSGTEVGMVFECGVDEIARISAKNEGSDIGPLMFSTASSTNANPTEKLRILSNGHVAIGDDIANDTGMFKVIAADGQSDDQYVGQFKNLEGTAGRNWGLLVTAGSNSTDQSLRVRNSAQNRDHLLIRGDGVKITTSRGLNYAKTYEFNYNDGAPGGVQTVSLATVANYGGTTSAVAEVTYVGVYGTAQNLIAGGKWICTVRRANSNSAWAQTAEEVALSGNGANSSLDLYWSSGQLYAQTVGPWMGWTVNVRITIINGDITVNV